MFLLLILFIFAAIGDPGTTGGSMSHEYHYISSIGEDNVYICLSCQYSINKVMCKESQCPECGSVLEQNRTAEVMGKINFRTNLRFCNK